MGREAEVVVTDNSVSDENIEFRNSIISKEAKATLEVGLGLCLIFYEGKDKMLELVTWNAKGLSHKEKQRAVRKLLRKESSDWGPKPFKFFNYWLEDSMYHKVVKDTWNRLQVDQADSSNIWSKLKEIKKVIKEWYSSDGVTNPHQIKKLENEIHNLENQNGYLWKEVRSEILEKKMMLWSLYRAEEQSWQQKSRHKWLKDGERNTKFFHLVASARRSVVRGVTSGLT
ncbi:hypothetical protein DITRI_Ditri04bG0018100 [Diplodiscus trichospermus]